MKITSESDLALHSEFVCPIETVFHLIGGKWRPRILWELGQSPAPLRFGELKTALGGISERVLSNHLRELESIGLVERTEHAVFPPKVEYNLSDLGRSLYPVFKASAEWIGEHRGSVRKIISNNPSKDWDLRRDP